MSSVLVLCCVLLLSAAHAAVTSQTAPASSASSSDVCILGAGPSGLHMARMLRERGYSVTVFERQWRVGGRVRSPAVDGGHRVEVGAVLLASCQTQVLEYVKRYNIPLVSIYDKLVSFADLSVGPASHVPLHATHLNVFKSRYVEAATARYTQDRLNEFPDIEAVGFSDTLYTRTAAARLFATRPVSDWLEAHIQGSLLSVMSVPLTIFGYGALNTVPLLYGLKYYNDTYISVTLPFLREPGADREALLANGKHAWVVPGGYESLFEALAGDLSMRGVRIVLGANVTRVLRPPAAASASSSSASRTRVFYRVVPLPAGTDKYDWPPANNAQVPLSGSGASAELECSCGRLVVAFPQLLERLQFLDLDADERALFTPVLVEHYYSAAVPAAQLANETATVFMRFADGLAIPATLDGSINTLFKFHHGKYAVAMGYSKELLSDAQIAAKFQQGMRSYNFGVAPPLSSLQHVHGYDYFPHVPAEKMRDFYAKLRAFQGRRLTYHTGGLLNFDAVEYAMSAAAALVREHFPPIGHGPTPGPDPTPTPSPGSPSSGTDPLPVLPPLSPLTPLPLPTADYTQQLVEGLQRDLASDPHVFDQWLPSLQLPAAVASSREAASTNKAAASANTAEAQPSLKLWHTYLHQPYSG